MKKFYTSLFAVLMGCAVLAAQSVGAPSRVISADDGAQVTRTLKPERKAHKARKVLTRERQLDETRLSQVMKAAPVLPENPPYITDRPEGDAQLYTKTGIGYGYNWFVGLYSEQLEGSLSEIITAPDGVTVYMSRPLSQYTTDGWIKGTRSGDEITFQLPQLVLREDYMGTIYEDFVMCLEFIADEEDPTAGWYYPCENQTFTLKVNDSGVLTEADQSIMIGHCALVDGEWSWQGNGDLGLAFTPLTDKPVAVPATAVFENWWLTGAESYTARGVSVSIDGRKVYIKGLFKDMPDAAVEGDLDETTNKVTVKSGQYLGEYWDMAMTTYFLAANAKLDTQTWKYSYTMRDDLVFDYDPQAKSLKSINSYAISVTKDRIYYITVQRKPFIRYQSVENVKVTSLITPIYDIYYPEEPEYGYYGELSFTLPNIDADDQVLDTSKLYWNLIMDDEVFVFMPDEYFSLDDNMTNVPYTFNDGNDFECEDGSCWVLIYPEGYENLGVRSVYVDGDNTVTSDIMWVPGFESALRDVTIGSTEIKAVRYYDLQGRVVENPSAGLYIRSVTFADGRVKNSKVVKR